VPGERQETCITPRLERARAVWPVPSMAAQEALAARMERVLRTTDEVESRGRDDMSLALAPSSADTSAAHGHTDDDVRNMFRAQAALIASLRQEVALRPNVEEVELALRTSEQAQVCAPCVSGQ
jgi:hypothetical protein